MAEIDKTWYKPKPRSREKYKGGFLLAFAGLSLFFTLEIILILGKGSLLFFREY